MVNRSVHYGHGPEPGSPLARGYERPGERASVAETFLRPLWVVLGTPGRLVGHFYIHNGDDSGLVCEARRPRLTDHSS
jgi:hypothetical protein